MSRTLNWVILFPKQTALRPDQLALISRQIIDAGFSFVNPHLGRIMLLGGSGEGFIPVLDENSLREYVATHMASLVSIWKEDLEISVEFDPSGVGLTEQAEALEIDDDSTFGAVTLYLNHTYLREPERAESVVRSVQHLFGRLCGCLTAPFGFALDEWSIEVLANEWHVQREVAAHTMPSIRFPVSYYSTGYFPNLSISDFERLKYVCDAIDSTGYLIANLTDLIE